MLAQDAGQKAHRESVACSAIDATCIAIDEARAETQLSATAPLFEDIDYRGDLETTERSLAVPLR